MTNDEAINTLKNTAWLGSEEQAEKVSEAVRMAVEALERETSGDAISRQAAIDVLMAILDKPKHAEFLYTDEICKALNELPSAQPERTDKHTETHACDCISRLGAIDICNNVIDLWQGQLGEGALVAIKNAINNLPSVQPDVPDTNVGDLISRQVAIDICHKNYDGILDFRSDGRTVALSFEDIINSVPSVKPEPLSDAYMKAVWTWLLDYQIKAAELKGRYTPYEVLSWVANDWRKEHE